MMTIDLAAALALFGLISSIQIGIGVWVVQTVHKMQIAVTKNDARFDTIEKSMDDIDGDVKTIQSRVDNWLVVSQSKGNRNGPLEKTS